VPGRRNFVAQSGCGEGFFAIIYVLRDNVMQRYNKILNPPNILAINSSGCRKISDNRPMYDVNSMKVID